MWDFLSQLEQTGFCTWVRESTSLFAFPGILLMHTIGMGLVVGINAGIDLRVLGIAPALPLAPLEKFFPIFWIGFWINAITGTILLVADATTKLANPDFYIKMIFIALALVNLRMHATPVPCCLCRQETANNQRQDSRFDLALLLAGQSLAPLLAASVGKGTRSFR